MGLRNWYEELFIKLFLSDWYEVCIIAEDVARVLGQGCAVCSGYQVVVIKLVREADDIVSEATGTLDNTIQGRLTVIQQ